MGESDDSTGRMQTLAFSFVKSVAESSSTTDGQIFPRDMGNTHRFLALGQALSNEDLPLMIHKKRQLRARTLPSVLPPRLWPGRTISCGKNDHSGSPSLGKVTGAMVRDNKVENQIPLTFGISTARSTPNFSPSFGLTLTLFAQLPTRLISLGGSKATFQLVSSVGSGSEYGTATPFFCNFRAASNGCWGEDGGISLRQAYKAKRNRSRGGILDGLGRTLGKRASI